MKKVISLILVVALFATLAISASAATVVVHEQDTYLEIFQEKEHGNGWCAHLNNVVWGGDYAAWAVRESSQQVKVLILTEGVAQSWTKFAEAGTVKEMKAVCANNEYGIENLTIYRQRNVTNVPAEGAEISVKLWPCAPDKHANQATVILFRAEGAEEWTVVGYAADKVCDATLPGNGAYIVAMAW